jgi:hypothetical protein
LLLVVVAVEMVTALAQALGVYLLAMQVSHLAHLIL